MVLGQRKTSGNFGLFLVFSVFLMVFYFAGLAWACTPTVTVHMSTNSGVAGTLVDLTGTKPATSQPVEIRWNSKTGRLLGTAENVQFAVTFRIPSDAAPGVYYVVVDGRARDTFEVTGSGGHSAALTGTSADLWSAFSGETRGYKAVSMETPAEQKPAGAALSFGLGLAASGAAGLCLALAAGQRRKRAVVSETRNPRQSR